MTFLQLFFLSLIQGITEFLPVSSSGHLVLLPKLMHWTDQGLELDVALHLGTLLAVIIYFFKEIWMMSTATLTYLSKGCSKKTYTTDVHLSFLIIISTLPTVILGFLVKKMGGIRAEWVISTTSIFFGGLLYLVDRFFIATKNLRTLTLKDAVFIGIAQSVALIPGASRSGICMTASRFIGLNRVESAKFAFLLSIPAILGAVVLTTIDALKNGYQSSLLHIGLGVFLSFIIGLASIHFLLRFLTKKGFLLFALYRIILGIIVLFTL